MNIKLSCLQEDGTHIEITFSSSYLPDFLGTLDTFVRACGFNPKGELQYISEDDIEIEPESDV
jgi:hypothetical protein